MRAQKASGSAVACARSRSDCSIDSMWACSEKDGGGGKTRSSCWSDSMFVVTVDMTPEMSPTRITALLLRQSVYHRIASRDNNALADLASSGFLAQRTRRAYFVSVMANSLCSNCGAEFVAGMNFCRRCGAAVVVSPDPSEQPTAILNQTPSSPATQRFDPRPTGAPYGAAPL